VSKVKFVAPERKLLNATSLHDASPKFQHEAAHPVLSGPATRQLSAGVGVPRTGACRDDVYLYIVYIFLPHFAPA
jgi:hypothetical protein